MKVEVRPATIAYQARVKHDGRLYEIPIPELHAPRCAACGELIFGNDTDEQINLALRAHLGLLQAAEIRAGREKLGLTQRQLADTLGMASESISRWETGLLIQSRASDNLLRLFFEIPQVRVRLMHGEPEVTGSSGVWDALLAGARRELQTSYESEPVTKRKLQERTPSLLRLWAAACRYSVLVEQRDVEALARSLAELSEALQRDDRSRRREWLLVTLRGRTDMSTAETDRIRQILAELDDVPRDKREQAIEALQRVLSLVAKH